MFGAVVEMFFFLASILGGMSLVIWVDCTSQTYRGWIFGYISLQSLAMLVMVAKWPLKWRLREMLMLALISFALVFFTVVFFEGTYVGLVILPLVWFGIKGVIDPG
jgi:hypothetical protein